MVESTAPLLPNWKICSWVLAVKRQQSNWLLSINDFPFLYFLFPRSMDFNGRFTFNSLYLGIFFNNLGKVSSVFPFAKALKNTTIEYTISEQGLAR